MIIRVTTNEEQKQVNMTEAERQEWEAYKQEKAKKEASQQRKL